MNYKKSIICSGLISLGILASSNVANAAPATWYDTVAGGTSTFNSMLSSGSSYTLNSLTYGNSWDFGAFSISTTDGASESIYGPSWNTSSGDMIGIDPSFSNTDQSGITFTFDNAINMIGFEVGDWGTCCTPSSLYISLGGGPAQLVATANSYNDNPTVAAGGGSGNDTIFVGAVDYGSTFTSVTFYGDGYGEILTAGGTVMYGNAVAAVPEPETYAMFTAGLGLIALLNRRRNSITS